MNRTFRILMAPGDGIGPEIMTEALKILGVISDKTGARFEFDEEPVGGAAIRQYGVALREEGLARARESDAVLFGAVGDPEFDDPASAVRPEQALLALRQGLGLFANLRPVRLFDPLLDESPLKPEVIRGTDIVVVRELTGGIYFGEPRHRWTSDIGREAVDTMRYTEVEVERILRVAFELALTRNKRLASVDKANILDTSRMWREIATDIAGQYPEVAFENVLVDACAMHLINSPTRFDVIVTENMFGDILTDEAAMLTGSLGMMPSASVGVRGEGSTGVGMYEPIHGSAPDIAGRGLANPLGMIMSAAMMLRLSFGLEAEAAAVEAAVTETLAAGHRTSDLVRGEEGALTTAQMGAEVAKRLETALSSAHGRQGRCTA